MQNKKSKFSNFLKIHLISSTYTKYEWITPKTKRDNIITTWCSVFFGQKMKQDPVEKTRSTSSIHWADPCRVQCFFLPNLSKKELASAEFFFGFFCHTQLKRVGNYSVFTAQIPILILIFIFQLVRLILT